MKMEEIKKQRGRPKGSKNSPKKLMLSQTQVTLAKKLGIPLEDYAKGIASIGNKKKVKVTMDWEKLAKDLDKALKDEIAESAKYEDWCLEWRKKYDDLEEKYNALDKEKSRIANVFAVKEIKLRGIIDYLEDKISGHDSV